MTLKRVLAWIALAIPLVAVLALFVGYWLSDNDCGDPAAAPPSRPMQAIVRCDYGTADVLRLEQVETPVPGDDEILVKVRAAAINPLDWHEMRGTPYLMRLGSGLRKPKVLRLGVDYAGTVEAVGRKVTRFKPGDEVFGGRSGALAEYVVARHDRAVAAKPPNVSFEQAATADRRDHRAAGAARRRPAATGREGADQRRLGRGGHLRRADREGPGRGGHRRQQHAQRRAGALARRRSRHRLHPGGLLRRVGDSTT